MLYQPQALNPHAEASVLLLFQGLPVIHYAVEFTAILQKRAGFWWFPKIGGTSFWGPYDKDPTS